MPPSVLDWEKMKVYLTEYFQSEEFLDFAGMHGETTVGEEIAFIAAVTVVAVLKAYEYGIIDAGKEQEINP